MLGFLPLGNDCEHNSTVGIFPTKRPTIFTHSADEFHPHSETKTRTCLRVPRRLAYGHVGTLCCWDFSHSENNYVCTLFLWVPPFLRDENVSPPTGNPSACLRVVRHTPLLGSSPLGDQRGSSLHYGFHPHWEMMTQSDDEYYSHSESYQVHHSIDGITPTQRWL